MNKIDNILPCLKSIIENTTCTFEIIVVAYLFSKENLKCLKTQYPQITIIESNVIRGFSENNNLALREAKGKYCFILNDDTLLKKGCIDKLVRAFKELPNNVAIVSPNIYDINDNLTVSGRAPSNLFLHILNFLHLKEKVCKKWVNQKGRFRTFNIIGAAFLIKYEIFKEVGWFDEYYFFAPEDVDLSTKINKMGYEVWVEPAAKLIHLEGMTSGHTVSYIKLATAPASIKGTLRFLSKNSWYKYPFVWVTLVSIKFIQLVNHFILAITSKNTTNIINYKASINCIKALFSRKTPKEIFLQYYQKLKPMKNTE